MKNQLTIILALCLILSAGCTNLSGQNIDKKSYLKKMRVADEAYDNGEFQKAANLYQAGFKNHKMEPYGHHRMNAAISFAQIDNKASTFEHLNALGTHGSSSEIRDIKVNMLFEKYHDSKEWDHLLTQMEKRIDMLTAHHKNLKVFSQDKKITYSALRINPKRDTIANTKITVYPMGTGWGGPATHQTQVVFQYEYSVQDSLDHISEVTETVGHRFWLKNDTVGIIEDETEVWMHPFRYNEFFKTEVAPFPVVHYPITNAKMYESSSKIVIMKNWGTYSPTMTEQKYFYVGEEIKNYDWSSDIKCHNFEAYGHNSAHGISNLKYSFNAEYGFTEMYYETYDGDKIIFKITKIESR